MSISRRQFLKNSGLTVAGLSLLQSEGFAFRPAGEITGLQLYSVRDDMGKDPLGTLKAVSKMGYKYVEHANYNDRKFYGWSVTDFKKVLSDLGLQMKTGHTVLGKDHWDNSKNDFTDLWKHTVEDAAAMGQEIVISPWLDDAYRKTADDLKSYMEVFNKCGKLCKQYGMMYGYHNHDFEFSQELGGEKVFDIIMKNTDPELVTLQLDTGNMYQVGAIAKDILEKYPGRFVSLHVKDVIEAKKGKGEMHGKYESSVLGKGLIDIKEVLELARKSGGTKHFIVEQESYQDKSPLACMKENLAAMKKWDF